MTAPERAPLAAPTVAPPEAPGGRDDRWSDLWSQVALSCLGVLTVSGLYLMLFFVPSGREVVYSGTHGPLRGVEMSAAYASTLDLSFSVRAGLLARQVHHWAALALVVAVTARVGRTFVLGRFQRPLRAAWAIGITLMLLSMFNGFLGVALTGDAVSGTAVRTAYAVALSVPVVGPALAMALFGGELPTTSFIGRFTVLHVFVVPVALAGLLALQLRAGRRWTPVARRARLRARLGPPASLLLATAAVLVAMGGLVEVNPVWLHGPSRGEWAPAPSAQPVWFVAWLEGAVRLAPSWESQVLAVTVSGPLLAGAILPALTIGALYGWPLVDTRVLTRRPEGGADRRRPGRAVRAALLAGTATFYGVLVLAAAADALAAGLQLPPGRVTAYLRVAAVGLPVVAAVATMVIVRPPGPSIPTVPPPEDRPAA